ncbi:Uncharacterized membrane-anchored protein YitT, contains DUF161 and DUF2179 domains [Acetitomaculum ruminis DSM 5522]|uniref:Uncharacterized membrane-anchored protein YitT, contains DUF161 and DUF2179 domains n=1 Tax=Acetitomaculum ruminis DSM 5522 TaxID=1120918 RepID=A0A1I0ZZX5_9FIRM|nr:YitT family protein [Acetitomaculum ruminis]SFB29858.1 Uncharacterized membrane-anchored protein YitT, contains DUF161 and DUF2179 domains [Acetitomaculum ruminis DSM 5522]
MSSKIIQGAKKTLLILFGNFLYALAVKFFLAPTKIATAGVTGIGLAVSSVYDVSTSDVVMILNIATLLIGLVFLGKEFAAATLLSTLSYPVFLKFLEMIADDVIITEDIFLCTIYAGVVTGLALGIVLRQGASTGGMDIPPLVINKYTKIPVSLLINVFDTLVLIAQINVFSMKNILYGIIQVMIFTFVLDKMLLLGNSMTQVKIVSKEYDKIRSLILTRVDRGVTLLEAQGGYTDEKTKLVMSVISNRQLSAVEKLVHETDPEALMIVTKVNEVSGRGFTLDRSYEVSPRKGFDKFKQSN